MGMEENLRLLKKFKVPLVKSRLVKSASEAISFAKGNYPIALKVVSSDIVHKTDQGCVIVGIENPSGLKKAYSTILKNAKKAEIEGMLVQEMASGTEVFIGGKRDPQFGSVVLFGLGGIFVEILEDISTRITPLTDKDAMEMISEIRGYPLLSGARGQKPVNLKALAKTIVQVSNLLQKHPEIKEMDLNPLFVDEKSVKAVDIRIITDGD